VWLVLCERGDADARWAADGLRRRGLEPLELVHADELAAAGWEHRVGRDGDSVSAVLRDGRILRSADVAGALNRLVAAPAPQLVRAAGADRAYARAELDAFALSWLAALPGRVVNRAGPQGLSGPWLHRSEWLVLAARAGLATRPYRSRPDGVKAPGAVPACTVTVVGARAFGPPGSRGLARACGRLARLLGVSLLEVALDGDGAFAGATTLPRLQTHGDALLDALAGTLR
jgi:hypothetical protein